ncbi:hypothetical protein OG777_19790 [Micromonospora peucetia]|uniref:hypothetical protein n=1 Tax=Micromonospora peucetia TaxID=47871 RepID=UPI00225975F8|nr:hypothetical protein [Micromonospora peucetia]MCX4389153.1 hypothetical protein [Micromonospora peucetia]
MAGVKIALVVTVLAGCAAAEPPERAAPPGTGHPTASAPPQASTAPSPESTTPASPGPTATTARVVLTRSGGFAGRGDTVTVEPDGRWAVVDRAGSRRTGRLSGTDLDRLRQLAANPALATEAGRPSTPTACQDAFSYRLTVGAVETGYVDCPADGSAPTTTREVVELLVGATD